MLRHVRREPAAERRELRREQERDSGDEGRPPPPTMGPV
jgi:hypothetical protein